MSVVEHPGFSATLQDVADEFGLSCRTVRRYVAAGVITGHRIGPKLIRFNMDTVREQLLGNRTDRKDTTGNDAVKRVMNPSDKRESWYAQSPSNSRL